MSDLRELYSQAIYQRQRAWRIALVIAAFFYVAGFMTGWITR